MAKFKTVLSESGMLLTSLNGFPFGDFHQAVVKKSVYLPHWAHTERLDYSKRLATILADCLPEDTTFGAISTLPLGYKQDWSGPLQAKAIAQLIDLSQFLKQLEQETGKHICFGLEMEPDCVFETTDVFVAFFQKELIPAAQQKNISKQQLLRYIGCCYDTCHQAVLHEDIPQSLHDIEAAGIRICKIQISNAVSANISTLEQVITLNELFCDAKFLHQTKVYPVSSGVSSTPIIALPDLSVNTLTHHLTAHHPAINIEKNESTSSSETIPTAYDVRVHYHIPINQQTFPVEFLSSTQHAIVDALTYLQKNDTCRPLLEIETYTWLNFLTEEDNQEAALISGLHQEFIWLEAELTKRKLLADINK
jgi:hypothetical protein